MVAERFQETWWLRGGHAQTLWPVLTRRVRLNVRSERLELPDGDCVRLDWAGEGGPIVIVLPGLQGDLESAYVRGIMRACQSRGWRAGPPVLAIAYHDQGNDSEAKESLTAAGHALGEWNSALEDWGTEQFMIPWLDLLECHILYREAYRRIRGDEPPEISELSQIEGRALATLNDP